MFRECEVKSGAATCLGESAGSVKSRRCGRDLYVKRPGMVAHWHAHAHPTRTLTQTHVVPTHMAPTYLVGVDLLGPRPYRRAGGGPGPPRLLGGYKATPHRTTSRRVTRRL